MSIEKSKYSSEKPKSFLEYQKNLSFFDIIKWALHELLLDILKISKNKREAFRSALLSKSKTQTEARDQKILSQNSINAKNILTGTPFAHLPPDPKIVPYKNLESSLQFRIEALKPKLSKRSFNNLSELSVNPSFQVKVIGFLEDAFALGKGKWIEITDALRTVAEQKRNVERWVSKTMKSKHLEGKAIDITYNGKYEIPVDIRRIAARNGLWNGGDMWGWDYPHFQDSPSIKSNKKLQVLSQMTARGTNPNDYDKKVSNIA